MAFVIISGSLFIILFITVIACIQHRQFHQQFEQPTMLQTNPVVKSKKRQKRLQKVKKKKTRRIHENRSSSIHQQLACSPQSGSRVSNQSISKDLENGQPQLDMQLGRQITNSETYIHRQILSPEPQQLMAPIVADAEPSNDVGIIHKNSSNHEDDISLASCVRRDSNNLLCEQDIEQMQKVGEDRESGGLEEQQVEN